MEKDADKGLYIVLISIHGLIRSDDLELGRDADTGGQIKYVVDFARALAECDGVERVELVTRLIVDDSIDDDYSLQKESISEKASIIRIPCGPNEYLPKEYLWEHLGRFSDNLLEYINDQDRMPDLIHSHYADAGYVATRLRHTTSLPIIHTGHSLGHDKRKRLMAAGMTAGEIEEKYFISTRIDAEEEVLANANLVIASTQQEIAEQYETYDYYKPENMRVIPPGTDLSQFHPPELGESPSKVSKSIRKFLDEPDKPIILALSRPDPRKNIASLMKAFGESKSLQEMANLVIIAGNRDDIREMDDGAQEVLSELLILIDYYNLYGKVAIPKKHLPSEVPSIYRMAAISCGVFVNPALTEPFGLTLLECAASGLPFVATENGGPVDIVKNCKSGVLVNPLDPKAMAKEIKAILLDQSMWKRFSSNGIKNVKRKYSWQAHARDYLKAIKPIIQTHKPIEFPTVLREAPRRVAKLIVTDLDKTLISDTAGLKELSTIIRNNKKTTAFGIATSRRLDFVMSALKKHNIPQPDILISSLGTEIYYSQTLTLSSHWANHVDHNWNSRAIRRLFADIPGLTMQKEENQSRFKLSFHLNNSAKDVPSYEQIVSLLRQHEQSVNVFLTGGQSLDITPARASKGLALRYVAQMWNIPLEQILVTVGGGADEDMIFGNTLSVVVANRRHEHIGADSDPEHMYFSEKNNAFGIIEAIEHYNFLGTNVE